MKEAETGANLAYAISDVIHDLVEQDLELEEQSPAHRGAGRRVAIVITSCITILIWPQQVIGGDSEAF